MPKGQRITGRSPREANKASARASQKQTVNIHFDRAPARRKRRAGGARRAPAAPPVINVHTVVSAPSTQPGMLPPQETYQQAPPPKPVQPEAKAERIAEPLIAKPRMNWADNLIDALSPGRHAPVIEPVAAAANRPRVETPAALPVAPEPMAAPPRPPPAAPMTPKPVPNIVEQIAPPPWRVETPTPAKPPTLKERATSLLKRITDELSKPLPGTEAAAPTQMHGNPLFDAPPTTAEALTKTRTRTRAPPVPVQEQMPVDINAPSDSDDVRWKGRAAGRGDVSMEPRRLGFTSPLKRETPVVEEAVPKDRIDSDAKQQMLSRSRDLMNEAQMSLKKDYPKDAFENVKDAREILRNLGRIPSAAAAGPSTAAKQAAPSWFDGMDPLGDLMQPISVRKAKKKADPRPIVSEADLNPIPAINLRGPKTCPVCGEQFATERLKNIHYGKVHAAKK